VAAHGSFTSAASALGLVPSALSETIQQIETETGVALFDRSARPTEPTPAGHQFLAEADGIVRQFESTIDSLRRTGGLREGHVSVATTPSALRTFLLPALHSVRRRHPGMRVTVLDGIGEYAESMVVGGQAELGLCARWNRNRDVHATLLAHDPFRLVCHLDHPLARRGKPVSLNTLEPNDIIGLGAGNAIARQLAAQPDLPFAVRNPHTLTQTTIAQLLLVQSNLGVAVLPEMAALALSSGTVTCLPIADLDLAREIYLIRHGARDISPAARAIQDEIITAADLRAAR